MDFKPFSILHRKLSRKLFGVISLKSQGDRGVFLLSFVTHPFTISEQELNKAPHTTPWECLTIADILLEKGFSVDVIEWTNTTFKPRKKYLGIIDIYQNLERISSILPSECLKILYTTGAHWKYQNEAEKARLDEFKKRHGKELSPRRQMKPTNSIDFADFVTSLGNNFSKDTYAFANKKITQIPLLSFVNFSSPENKDFEKIKKNFVWIGGGGAVHKGLDLLLEYFAVNPDLNLTVCGPVESESDFFNFYKKELYDLPNIKFVGRIDLRGDQFKEIAQKSIALIYPSCSEGQVGAVISGLHAGLIPIVTFQSGVDVEPFGIKLNDISNEEIDRSVRFLTSLSGQELRQRSIQSWQYANKNHTKETYKNAYSSFIDKIIKERNL